MGDTAIGWAHRRTPHTTVDGVPVALGDRVWFVHLDARISYRKLDRYDLGMHWDSWISKSVYSTRGRDGA